MNQTIVASSMKNESPYILEWLAHYRAIGFGEVFIVTNNNDDLTLTLLAELQRNLSWFSFKEHAPKVSPQGEALNIIYKKYKDRGGWLFFCDADEFLVPNRYTSINRLLEEYCDHDAISFYWKVFGSNGQSSRKPGHVIDRFTRCGLDDSPQHKIYKTLTNLAGPWKEIGLHKPIPLDASSFLRWVDGAGNKISQPELCPSTTKGYNRYSLCQLNHYMVKSKAEFQMKMVRGNAFRPKQGHLYNKSYFRANDLNSSQCRAISKFRHVFDSAYQDIVSRGSISRIVQMIEVDQRRRD